MLRNPWSRQGREQALCWLVSAGPEEAAGYNSDRRTNRSSNNGKRLHSTDDGPVTESKHFMKNDSGMLPATPLRVFHPVCTGKEA